MNKVLTKERSDPPPVGSPYSPLSVSHTLRAHPSPLILRYERPLRGVWMEIETYVKEILFSIGTGAD